MKHLVAWFFLYVFKLCLSTP